MSSLISTFRVWNLRLCLCNPFFCSISFPHSRQWNPILSHDVHPMCAFSTILNKVFITFVASNKFAKKLVWILMWQSIPCNAMYQNSAVLSTLNKLPSLKSTLVWSYDWPTPKQLTGLKYSDIYHYFNTLFFSATTNNFPKQVVVDGLTMLYCYRRVLYNKGITQWLPCEWLGRPAFRTSHHIHHSQISACLAILLFHLS